MYFLFKGELVDISTAFSSLENLIVDTALHCGVYETGALLYRKCFGSKQNSTCDLYGLANNMIAHKMDLLKVGESIMNVIVSKTLWKESLSTP